MTAALARLESIARRYEPGLAAEKRALLRRLTRTPLSSAAQVLRLHEVACFLAAYPDDRRVHAAARTLLQRFARRPDLGRFARRLVSSGLAGTAIEFPFFSRMARWLAARWPERLGVRWKTVEQEALLEALLPFLAHPAVTPALDEYDLGLRGWVDRLRGPRRSDGAFLVEAIAALPASEPLRVALHDTLDLPLRLAWGPGGPSRTTALAPASGAPRVHVQRRPLARERPDLAIEAGRRPLEVRALSRAEGERTVDLAREAMVTRQRDLDAFANADARDVRLVTYEDGLAFACLGVKPDDRLLLESVYGMMTLKNRVPIGYVLTSALYGSCELAYNVFDTFRGAEAALVYARVIALARLLFGADAFTIVPYQLGDGNDEAIESGAWWFYYKLGFRPLSPTIRRVVAREERRMRRDPEHRSSAAALRRLARGNLFLTLGPERRDMIGRLPLAGVGIAVSEMLVRRFGSARVEPGPVADEARRSLGITSLRGWSAEERRALERWAPLALLLLGSGRWSAAERRELVEVVRAKGGRRESEFVRRFDAHTRLRATVAEIARRGAI